MSVESKKEKMCRVRLYRTLGLVRCNMSCHIEMVQLKIIKNKKKCLMFSGP